MNLIKRIHDKIMTHPFIAPYSRVLKYGIIGGISAIVQLTVFTLLLIVTRQGSSLPSAWRETSSAILGNVPLYELIFLLIAIECAILTNFTGQYHYTFKDRKGNVPVQLLQFHLVAIAGVIVQSVMYTLLRSTLLVRDILFDQLASSAIAIIIAFSINFTLNYLITFKKKS